jgi:protein TonB
MRLKLLVICLVAAGAYVTAQDVPSTVGATETGAPIYRVDGKVKPPKPKFTPDPVYPKEALAKKLTGTTVLWATIGPDGSVSDVKIKRPFEPGLDQATLDAVKKWKFKPATLNGKPVAVQINIEMNHRPYSQ